ncbi:MAG: 3-isopropylmalate dehydratase small subunit [Pseudomonadota bacterium]|nr:3-isopropylmalate dehydratase small subunit [Pseudomonadota bacterium]
MKKFLDLESIPAVINEINIDTDDIIPKQFLKTIHRTGLGKYLFYNRRFDKNSNKKAEFILNNKPWNNSKILLAGSNFGCGSSREHAPWALLDFGIECIIAPSFADIFYNNSIKNGLLLLTLSKSIIDKLSQFSLDKKSLTVSLLNKNVFCNNLCLDFNISEDIRERLINGYDDIELTLKESSQIDSYENENYNKNSWKLVDSD